MTLTYDSRRLTAAVLGIVLLVAAFVMVCPYGAFAAVTSRPDACCTTKAHVTGLAPSVESEPRATTALPAPALLAGAPAWVPPTAMATASVRALEAWPGLPADPLNGRLRL